jgi:hypothetical protein
MRILLIGTGYMAGEYAKVLQAQNIDFDIVGRGKANCDLIRSQYPTVEVFEGGVENFEASREYTHAVITTNIEYLTSHTRKMLEIGVFSILLEKPGGRDFAEISALAEFAKQHSSSEIFIAYNRRFYSSVIECQRLIKEDGGILSFHFEFTEWPHTVENMPNYEIVKENLFFANSTHVLDLAFFLGGFPSMMNCYSIDKLEWHRKAIFAGAGISDKNALFCYQSNWKGPGRWNVEMITAQNRYILKPLEQLQVQPQRSVKIDQLAIDDSLDKIFKPGLYKQVEAFLRDPSNPSLLKIETQANNCSSFYQVILNGNTPS